MQDAKAEDLPFLLILHHFSSLPDPRVDRTRRHSLASILLISFAAVLCGADGWDEIAAFGQARFDWLSQLVEMPDGSPSADTIRRVFAALDPRRFEACYRRWIAALCGALQEQVVALDGKTLRGSGDAAAQRSGLHLLHAWAGEQNLLLGQCAVAGAPGEPSAAPPLLDALAIEGAVVTFDANGCTKAVAGAVLAKKADYVLHLKGNRGRIHAHVVKQFDVDLDAELAAGRVTVDRQQERGHGRVEDRTVWAATPQLPEAMVRSWPGLKSVAMIERSRTMNDHTSHERHYYLSSLPSDARRIGRAARAHWSVENNLHWSLDVGLREDACCIRQGFAVQNLALVRRIVLTLLKQPAAGKQGVAAKRKRAGWDSAYLLHLLSLGVPAG